MAEKILFCKECGSVREVGRKLCRSCNLERQKQYVSERPRYMFEKVCEACGSEYKAWRKVQKFCKECFLAMQNKPGTTNKYVFTNIPGKTKHRELAQEILGRKLQTNEVVHHLDEDPRNNEPTNLVVLTRTAHNRLHLYLNQQRVILEKSRNENFENCWNSLRVPMTTTWLETTSVKVIKLWEIGQSAAEPLNEKSHEEGSETMHETPNHLVEGEDIVQTTTVQLLAG